MKNSTLLSSAQPAIKEFVRALGYREFGLSPEEIAPLVDDLMSLATIVHPRHTVDVVTRDPTDNLFLEIALCSVLVSGDRHLLRSSPVSSYSHHDTIHIRSFL